MYLAQSRQVAKKGYSNVSTDSNYGVMITLRENYYNAEKKARKDNRQGRFGAQQ